MAEVKFKRIESSEDINNVPIVDGQLIYTGDGRQFMDYENSRVNLNYTGVVETILWENPSPNDSFSSQEITLSSGDYDEIIWFFLTYISGETTSNAVVSQMSLKNYGCAIFLSSYSRGITYISDTVYSIGDCSSSTFVSNERLIPICAIGRKTGIFGE